MEHISLDSYFCSVKHRPIYFEVDMDNLRNEIVDKAYVIAETLKKGVDVEIRKTKDGGITVAEIKKKVIAR